MIVLSVNYGGCIDVSINLDMAIDKRDLPLTVLRALDRITKEPSDLFRITEGGGIIVRFEDNHPSPSQFFEFVKFENNQISLVIRPKSANDPSMTHISVTVDKVDAYFEKWLQYLEGYKNAKLLDDPILRKYEEEAYAEFELVEEDSDTVSYDLSTQLLIDKYLEHSIKKLNHYDSEDNQIKEIKLELEQLRETQTQLTKKEVVKSLATILAKARKHGLKLLGELYNEAKKELFKQLITGGTELLK